MKGKNNTKSSVGATRNTVKEDDSTKPWTTATTLPSTSNETLSSTSLALAALHLALFVAQFESLVADPIRTLSWGLLPLSALQSAWIVKCLDRTETPSHQAQPTPLIKTVRALRSLLPALVLGTPITAVILVLFGAPLTTHHAQTLLCAAHMAVMAGPGLVRRCGTDGRKWRETCALLVPADEAVGGAMGTAVGAWVGAVPIPLDWSVFLLLFRKNQTFSSLPFIPAVYVRDCCLVVLEFV